MKKYNELRFKLPSHSSHNMAKKAVNIIKAVNSAVPSAKNLLLEPSNILLLAGARAISPYNGFESLNDTEFKKLELALTEHSISIFNELTPYDNVDFVSFSLINEQEIKKLDQKYEFLKKKMKPPIGFERQDLIEWFFIFERKLASMIDEDLLPKAWDNSWLPHNLRFGMLLGYPGIAISSMLWDVETSGSYNEILIAEDGDDFPSVGFYVKKSLAKELEITEISLLWKSIIEIVKQEFN